MKTIAGIRAREDTNPDRGIHGSTLESLDDCKSVKKIINKAVTSKADHDMAVEDFIPL